MLLISVIQTNRPKKFSWMKEIIHFESVRANGIHYIIQYHHRELHVFVHGWTALIKSLVRYSVASSNALIGILAMKRTQKSLVRACEIWRCGMTDENMQFQIVDGLIVLLFSLWRFQNGICRCRKYNYHGNILIRNHKLIKWIPPFCAIGNNHLLPGKSETLAEFPNGCLDVHLKLCLHFRSTPALQ